MSAIYAPDLTPPIIVIEEEEYHHAVRSLRVQLGEKIWLTDGKGTIAQGIIQRITESYVEIRLIERIERLGEPPAPIGIVVAPLRQPSRTEWIVEKAVELGATAIYFLPMERAIKKRVELTRLNRIAHAALKQNLRSTLPELRFLSEWGAIPWEAYPKRLMGEIGASRTLKEALPLTPTPTLWLVGPEGDFTPSELTLLKSREVEGVSLGRLRLRAETAAILFLSAIKTMWGY